MEFKNHIFDAINDKRIFYAILINGMIFEKTCLFFSNKGFCNFSLPSLSKCLFKKDNIISLNLDGDEVSLSSSHAMEISALSSIYGKVYSVNNCYRCKEKKDKNHLIEFKLLEVEFEIKSEREIFDLLIEYLKFMVDCYNSFLLEHNLLSFFEPKNINFVDKINYVDISSLFKEYNDYDFVDNELTSLLSDLTFVLYYPCTGSWRALKKDSNTSYLYNLILPDGFGELAEFSIRETDYRFYQKKFDFLGYEKYYAWYIEALKQNAGKRAGFGIGLERLGAWLMNLKSIDTQLSFSVLP